MKLGRNVMHAFKQEGK